MLHQIRLTNCINSKSIETTLLSDNVYHFSVVYTDDLDYAEVLIVKYQKHALSKVNPVYPFLM